MTWAVLLALMAVAASMLAGALWMFSLPLIADRGLAFWPAMEFSRKLSWRNFGGIVLLVVVIALMNLAGLLLLCVGMLITLPVRQSYLQPVVMSAPRVRPRPPAN